MPHLSTYVRLGFLLLVIAILVLSGTACQEAPTRAAPTASPLVFITPYATSTPVPPTMTPSPLATLPIPPEPTATPFLHTITNDDTMLGLALKYGVSLEAILAANPDVNPHFMSVGKTVVIPLKDIEKTPAPTATPAPLSFDEARCFPAVDGGAWCLVSATNQGSTPVENASAWIGLFTGQGEAITGTIAISPLNVLYTQDTLPLMAYFPAPLPEIGSVRVEQISAIDVSDLQERYIQAEPGVEKTDIDPSGLAATVQGRVSLPEDGAAAQTLWIALIAYDTNGNIAGVRKWDSSAVSECSPPPVALTPAPTQTPQSWKLPPACLEYRLQVYSLGPAIERIEVKVEARP